MRAAPAVGQGWEAESLALAMGGPLPYCHWPSTSLPSPPRDDPRKEVVCYFEFRTHIFLGKRWRIARTAKAFPPSKGLLPPTPQFWVWARTGNVLVLDLGERTERGLSVSGKAMIAIVVRVLVTAVILLAR